MKNKYIIYFIIVILIGIAIFFLTRKKEINKFEFPDTVVVENHTDNYLADTLSMVILNKIFNYDTITLQIFPKPSLFNYSQIKIIAFVMKNHYEDNSFIIFLENNISFNRLKRVLSHEIIHIEQMMRNDLITEPMNTEYVIYKNDTIFFKETPYEFRQHEIDAYNRDYVIHGKLNELLYK